MILKVGIHIGSFKQKLQHPLVPHSNAIKGGVWSKFRTTFLCFALLVCSSKNRLIMIIFCFNDWAAIKGRIWSKISSGLASITLSELNIYFNDAYKIMTRGKM